MHDREILTLYVNRDPRAIAAMQEQYGSYCAAIVGRILADPRDVEECLNDLWLKGSSTRFPPWEMLKRYNE